MIGDVGQHVSEIRFGIATVEFGAADQAVDCGGSLAAGVGAGEQVVFSAQGDGAQGTAETNIKCPYCTEVIAAGVKKCRRKSCGALGKKRWLVSDRRGLI